MNKYPVGRMIHIDVDELKGSHSVRISFLGVPRLAWPQNLVHYGRHQQPSNREGGSRKNASIRSPWLLTGVKFRTLSAVGMVNESRIYLIVVVDHSMTAWSIRSSISIEVGSKSYL